jgi:hypothetical protein
VPSTFRHRDRTRQRSSRDRDRRLDDRHRHLGVGRSRHLHRGRRLDVRRLRRRHPDVRLADLHLLDELRGARGADLGAELPGGVRLGSPDEARLRHRDGGRRLLRHLGACPGWKRTGCCPGAIGPCPGSMRRGCCPDAVLDEDHGDVGSRGLRHHRPEPASHRRGQRDAARSALPHQRLPLARPEPQEQLQRQARREPPVPVPELAQACAWARESGPTSLREQPSWPARRGLPVQRERTVLACCPDARLTASLRRDAERPASKPREQQPGAARRLRRWTSVPREGDGPRGARRSTKRS